MQQDTQHASVSVQHSVSGTSALTDVLLLLPPACHLFALMHTQAVSFCSSKTFVYLGLLGATWRRVTVNTFGSQ
jgi:hypothetical protein